MFLPSFHKLSFLPAAEYIKWMYYIIPVTIILLDI